MTFPRHLTCSRSWKYCVHIKASPDVQVSEVRKSLKTLYMSKIPRPYLQLGKKLPACQALCIPTPIARVALEAWPKL